MSIAGRAGGLVIVIAAGLLVIGSAVVSRFAATSPATAGQIWSSHPAVQIAAAMQDIAQGARAGRPADDQSLLQLQEAAAREPLAPEPFLANGIADQLSGRIDEATASFAAAKLRDPRSLPARYFLSGIYLRSNNVRGGLEEVAEFAKLSPNGMAAVGPYVAAVASQRSTWPELRALFRENPSIEHASLVALAADPANAETVIALQGGRRRAAEAPWISVLIKTLIAKGDYRQARALFATALEPPPPSDGLLFDRAFDQPDPPAPFNWTLASSSVGLAERQKGGLLHAIYYGQEDGPLASQLLVLSPGQYRLSMTVSGGEPALSAMSWRLRCATGGAELLAVSLAATADGPARFGVPATCPAQLIELIGRAGDVAQSAEVTIGNLRLEREAPGA